MLRGIQNITIPSISQIMAYSGRMSLPVDSSSLIYSYFEHVSGIPAPKGSQGLNISKLNLLDVLIGRLNQTKNSASTRAAFNTSSGAASGAASSKNNFTQNNSRIEADSIIESYRNLLREAKAASEAMPYIRAPNTQPGALFSLLS